MRIPKAVRRSGEASAGRTVVPAVLLCLLALLATLISTPQSRRSTQGMTTVTATLRYRDSEGLKPIRVR